MQNINIHFSYPIIEYRDVLVDQTVSVKVYIIIRGKIWKCCTRFDRVDKKLHPMHHYK